ncbi:MAG: hypothetical protein ACUVX9_07975 [Anaerolineae bacterium]
MLRADSDPGEERVSAEVVRVLCLMQQGRWREAEQGLVQLEQRGAGGAAPPLRRILALRLSAQHSWREMGLRAALGTVGRWLLVLDLVLLVALMVVWVAGWLLQVPF